MTVNSPIHFAQIEKQPDIDHNQQTRREECDGRREGGQIAVATLHYGSMLLDSV